MGWVDQQGSKFFRNCFPPASFQQYLTRESFNTGSPSLWFSKRLQLRDHRKSGQGSFVSAKYLSSDPPVHCVNHLSGLGQELLPDPDAIQVFAVTVSLSCSWASMLCTLLHIQAQMCKILAIYKVMQVYYQDSDNSSSSLCVCKIYSRFLWVLLLLKKSVQKQRVYWEKKLGKTPQRKMSLGLH